MQLFLGDEGIGEIVVRLVLASVPGPYDVYTLGLCPAGHDPEIGKLGREAGYGFSLRSEKL